MTHPTKPQWARMCDQLRTLVDRLEHDGPALFDRDRHSAQADGYPSSSMGGSGRNSDVSDPTYTAALANSDETARRRDKVHDDAVSLHSNANQAMKALHAAVGCILHAQQQASDKPVDHGPAGTCIICDRRVEGTSADRLRRGMCSADFMAWTRAGRPDVNDFKRDRNAEAA